MKDEWIFAEAVEKLLVLALICGLTVAIAAFVVTQIIHPTFNAAIGNIEAATQQVQP